ncbi:formylglycine-generating enzyme family protein [Sandarakinorhabdus rubra]|uniref:formylglycine-generating enzyme family protein n=1 Tax=Sandarakinorhabdus rubra TaxID=2672568 RepID=UPI0013DADDAA|nr:formylglycine-generating enzyme family protein [Sandarakinorhabdus rubra]
MRLIPGGAFTMGAMDGYPEEAPLRRVALDPFFIDETPVTNRQFARFVAATGHVTVAEVAPDPRQYPGMPPELAVPGSLVFTPPAGPVPLDRPDLWWRFVPGADWRHPQGPGPDIEALGLMDHPVVQVAWADAAAYARWAGKALPTEAEHECAARGGLEGMRYAWGDELAPGGRQMANIWQGVFPHDHHGRAGTTPVGRFPPNGHGLYDMIGNVWEWTADWWEERPRRAAKRHPDACCTLRNPRGGTLHASFDPAMPHVKIGRKVLKGGSHLCAENHCQRYRPAARHPEMIDTATTHIGFRCVKRVSPPAAGGRSSRHR